MKSLFRLLHTHFIPHEGNAYQPHFLRLKIAAGVLALIITLEGLYLAQTLLILPSNSYFAAIFASVLVDETNEHRNAEALGTLRVNITLERAAQMKADDMATKGYFAHNAPDGKTPWYWFDQAGYDYVAAGENLAVNFTDSKDVTEAWMRSPSHRANIMNGNYTEIGIGTAHGIYKGREAIFVVQEFGRPSPVVAKQAIAQVLATTTPKIIPKPITRATQVKTAPKPSPIIHPTTIASSSAPLSLSTTTAVAGAETERIVLTPQSEVVAQAYREPNSTIGSARELFTSPRRLTTMIYLLIGGVLLVALSLTVFVKVHIQHPRLIRNGILLLAITFSFIVLNAALGLAQGVI